MSELKLSKNQIHILKHTLGLDRNKKPYRNHYVASEGHPNIDALEDLVAQGAMTKGRCFDQPTYWVTDLGADFLDTKLPGD